MTLILTPPRATYAKRQQMSSFQVVSFISEKERSLKEQKFWSFRQLQMTSVVDTGSSCLAVLPLLRQVLTAGMFARKRSS
jgi:hypothetical protein